MGRATHPSLVAALALTLATGGQFLQHVLLGNAGNPFNSARMLGYELIFLAGMATIDQELYDAARVDGAGSFTVMTRITIPLLRRFIQFTFIVTLITAFTALFSLIFVMTGGGPGYGTTTLEFFIYEQGFSTGDFGLASTAGVTLFVAVAVVGLLQVRLLRTED